jgi:F-type H+-transporting ATPase subunit gamma
VLRAGERLVLELQRGGTAVRLYCVGKKAPSFYRFRGIAVEQTFAGFVDRPSFSDARLVASAVAAPFIDGEAQEVLLVSTRFHSAGSQGVETEQLLPLSMPEPVLEETTKLKGYTEFEPEVEQLLTSLAPRALESEIFSALLEGAASFHISQQRAMAAATDNADELGQSLTRIMNRARQDSITTEIMEIVGGAEALRSGK